MKKFILAIALVLAPTLSWAQCNGIFAAGTVCGNPSASPNVPSATSSILSRSPTAGIGYGAGSGGTVTQATNKSTAVTLNTITGTITTNNAALGAGAFATFQVNNSTITGNEVVILSTASGTSGYQLDANKVVSGSFFIVIQNVTGGSLSEAVAINFAVIRTAQN